MKLMQNKIFRYVGIALIVIGIIVIIYPFYTNFVMKRKEAQILDAWEEQLEESTITAVEDTIPADESALETVAETSPEDASEVTTAEETGSVTTVPEELFILDPEKKVPFKILIPKIGVEWIVHEGTDIPSMRRGPGHYPGTSLPGEPGLCLIAGHRTTYGAPFNKVDTLINGDEIILQTANGENFVYYVNGMVETLPDDVSVLQQTNYPSLAISTCTPKYYATRRLIVFANMEI